jgi:hypothetical protein
MEKNKNNKKKNNLQLLFFANRVSQLYVMFFGAHMRRTRLYPLNSGVTEVLSEEMLTVGRNLDRTGQNPYLFTLL